jgi:hypothetical protein
MDTRPKSSSPRLLRRYVKIANSLREIAARPDPIDLDPQSGDRASIEVPIQMCGITPRRRA